MKPCRDQPLVNVPLLITAEVGFVFGGAAHPAALSKVPIKGFIDFPESFRMADAPAYAQRR